MRLTVLTLSILLGVLLLHVVTAGVKMGSCPGAPVRPARCDPSEVRDSCKDDAGCKGRKKCCPTYCGKRCTEPGSVKLGSCPVVNPFAPCKYPLPKVCNFDSDCLGIWKCCQDGCRIQCTEPRVPDQVPSKPGKCPITPIPFIPCPPEPPEEDHPCTDDWGCEGKQKCCPSVCQFLCKDPPE